MRQKSWPRKMGLVLAFAALGLFACKDPEVHEKLDQLITKVDALEKKVTAGGPAGKRPQRPNRPDPKTVYSVPIDGDAYDGPKLAKVTIIEASDFA